MVIFHRTEIPMIPARREIPETQEFPGNLPGIPVRETPRREKFEAIREGRNGNFPLNITASCSCA